MQKSRRCIEPRGLLELLRERLHVAPLRCNLEPHGRLAIELEALELNLERERAAPWLQRVDFERVIGPAAVQRRDERTLQRRVRMRPEIIHQGLRLHRGRVLETEQVEPRGIRIDDDALLDVRDRIGRAGHERAHLVAVLACRGERTGEGAVERSEMQFALGDSRQPRPRLQRDDVARSAPDRVVRSSSEVCCARGSSARWRRAGHGCRRPATSPRRRRDRRTSVAVWSGPARRPGGRARAPKCNARHARRCGACC